LIVAPPPYWLKNARVAGALAAMNCGVGTQLIWVSKLRTRMYSRLLKKWSLSRTTGPPMLNPIWWRVNSPCSMPFDLLSNVLVESLSLR
jgi:hypothetical protein